MWPCQKVFFPSHNSHSWSPSPIPVMRKGEVKRRSPPPPPPPRVETGWLACLLIRDILQTSLAPSNPAHISTSLSSLRQQPQNDARKLSLHLSWLAKSLPPLKGSSVRRHVLTLLTGRAVIRVVEWSEIEGDAWKIVNVKSMLVALRHRYMERAGLEPLTDQRHNGFLCDVLSWFLLAFLGQGEWNRGRHH